jgi:membrane associated rhomboid family serine protease
MPRRSSWQDSFTFGGRLPWAVGLALSLTIGLSLLVAFSSRHTAPFFELLSLTPGEVWRGQVWRLVTWPFIEPSVLSLIFACLFLYWFGRDLADEWGSPRFLAVFGGVALGAAVGTCLVAQMDKPVLDEQYLGSWAVTAAMVVAWGLWFPDRVVRLYFVLPIRGYWLAWLTVAITVVLAIYSGWERYLPELFAEGSTLAWMFRRSIVARWARARRAAGERREAERRAAARKRAKSVDYLRVVEADDDPPPLPPDVEAKIQDLLGGRRKPGDD